MSEKSKTQEVKPAIKNKKLSFWGWLVVVGIMLIIWILIPSSTIIPHARVKPMRAEADIASMESAIAMYKTDTGIYPENNHSDWESIDVLAWRLTGKQEDSSTTDSSITSDPNWHGPYIKSIQKDPWGEYYYYTNNKADIDGTNKQVGVPTGEQVPKLSYYIYSKGKDKLTGLGNNADDITCWDTNKLWNDSYYKK